MKIFVINAGSSSIKYQLFDMPSEEPVCVGLVERIGLATSKITHKIFINGLAKELILDLELKDHEAGLSEVTRLLTEPEIGVIQDPYQINVVGHRVVHGGESFSDTTLITKEVKEEIKNLYSLAPLHNPGNFMGIEVAEKLFRNAAQVVVFDTAFHQTIPEKAYRYAIPETFYAEDGIRVYGFHGTSHKFVTEAAANYLNNDKLKLISIHLGNGCSMAAVVGGKCVDTSMGFTPLDGLIMGTRSGNIDPSVVFYIMEKKGLSSKETDVLLNKKSGMLGMTGYNDMREIKKLYQEGNTEAVLAYEMYAYRIQKFIGAYSAAMNGLDAVIFTAGVGENDQLTRTLVCQNLEFLGIELDSDKNEKKDKGIREINVPSGKVKILVIPTNEELEIANQCYSLVLNSIK